MSRPADPARPDVYTRITQTIITHLEAGVRPWTQPWRGGGPVSRPLRHDGTPYRIGFAPAMSDRPALPWIASPSAFRPI